MTNRVWVVVVKDHNSDLPSAPDCKNGDVMIDLIGERGDGKRRKSKTLIRGYQIQSVGHTLWEDIPADVKEENRVGWRFIEVREDLTADNFNFMIIE